MHGRRKDAGRRRKSPSTRGAFAFPPSEPKLWPVIGLRTRTDSCYILSLSLPVRKDDQLQATPTDTRNKCLACCGGPTPSLTGVRTTSLPLIVRWIILPSMMRCLAQGLPSPRTALISWTERRELSVGVSTAAHLARFAMSLEGEGPALPHDKVVDGVGKCSIRQVRSLASHFYVRSASGRPAFGEQEP